MVARSLPGRRWPPEVCWWLNPSYFCSVPGDISFQEIMTKLTYLIDGGMLNYMFDDHDRHESAGSLKLRACLFPANLTVIENHMAFAEHRALELRYIDAINGIIRVTPWSTKPHPVIIVGQRGIYISSVCSSSGSPMSCTTKARVRVFTKRVELSAES
ncbi:Hypothetical predicted protein [Olea europaea subsp. europaea]|uniref:Uncharacterized protein n=1 Tax=Olea europaea subsp. europaea TaxID=158383 RepID=A0A8S0UCK2_OLEEU|nr:Hypothetical predicted protein [Olea europaea subsp. europaea]